MNSNRFFKLSKWKIMQTVLLLLLGAVVAISFLVPNSISNRNYVSADEVDAVPASSLEGFVPTALGSGEYFETEVDSSVEPNATYYLISDADDLRTLAYFVNTTFTEEQTSELELQEKYSRASYRMTNHIDLSRWTQWEPIGTMANPFSGSFSGQGYSIYGLTIIDDIEEPTTDTYAGLFGNVSYLKDGDTEYKPVIQRLGLKDTIIKTNREYVGSIVAVANGVNPMIYGADAIINPTFRTKTEVENISSDQTVNRAYSDAQGSLVIQDCYNVGYVEGGNYVGGLAGALYYGAVIYNCYNAPSTTNAYNTNYDVYSSNANANIGGITGYVEFSSAMATISQTINTAAVGKLNATNDSNNIGYIVGRKTAIQSTISLYASNLYLTRSLRFTNDTIGTGYGYVDMADRYVYASLNNYSLISYNPGVWASDTSTIWAMQPDMNNGLPMLYNVPQLVKYDFVAQDVDGNELIASEAISEAVDTADLEAYDGALLFEQGTSFLTRGTSVMEYKYEFSKWSEYYTANSIEPAEYEDYIANSDISSVQFFTNHDATIIAVFGFKTYTLTLTADPSDKIDGENTIISIRDGISNTYNNVQNGLTVEYNDEITIQGVATTGYEISAWTTMYQDAISGTGADITLSVQAYIDAYMSASQAEIPVSLNIIAHIQPKSYDFSINEIDSSIGTITATVNGGDSLGTSDSVEFGSQIALQATVTDPNYEFISWVISFGNGTTQQIELLNYSFTVQDQGSISITANFDKKKFYVTISSVAGGSALVISATESSTSGNSFYYDETIEIQATASTGYELTGINVYKGEELIDLDSEGMVFDLESGVLTITTLNADIRVVPVFSIMSFDLTVVVTPADGATVTYNGESIVGTNEFVYNTDVPINVFVTEGYELVSITSDDGAVYSNGNFVKVLKDTTITITLQKQTFVVNVTINYDSSSAYSIDASCINGVGQYTYGDVVEISFDVPVMFRFSRWDLARNYENSSYDSVNGTFTCTGIEENIYLTVYFALVNTQITFTAEGVDEEGGWYLYDGSNMVDTQGEIAIKSYANDVRVQLASAYRDNGEYTRKYTFSHWEINGIPVSSASDYTFKVTGEEMNVNAVFMPVELRVTANVVRINENSGMYDNLSEAGDVKGLLVNTYHYGDVITLEASTHKGFVFLGWYVWNENLDSSQANGRFITDDPTITLTITSNTKIYAAFERISNVTIQMSDDSAGTTTGSGTYMVGENITLSATPNTGYRFVSWQENGSVVSNDANYRLTVTRDDRTLLAVFEPIFTITLISSNDDYGKIIGNTSGNYRENVTLRAVSENNCSFVGWVINDKIVSTSDTLSLNLNGDIEVRALFKKNFDWNILIILVGCVLFAGILIAGSAAYIKMREAEPMPVRVLLNSKDDKEALQKPSRRNQYRDTIEPVPTRKNTKANVAPIPVRKITVAPINHKGELVGRTKRAAEEQPTLKTETTPEKPIEKETKSEKTEKPKTTTAAKSKSTQNSKSKANKGKKSGGNHKGKKSKKKK